MDRDSIHSWQPLRIVKFTRRLLIAIYYFSKVPRFTGFFMYIMRPLYEPTKETWLNRKVRYGLLTFGGGLLTSDAFRATVTGRKPLWRILMK